MKKMSNPMTIMPVSSLIILLLIPRAVSVRSAASGAPFGLDSRATEISASAHKAHSSPRWTERRRAASFCFVCHLVSYLIALKRICARSLPFCVYAPALAYRGASVYIQIAIYAYPDSEHGTTAAPARPGLPLPICLTHRSPRRGCKHPGAV